MSHDYVDGEWHPVSLGNRYRYFAFKNALLHFKQIKIRSRLLLMVVDLLSHTRNGMPS